VDFLTPSLIKNIDLIDLSIALLTKCLKYSEHEIHFEGDSLFSVPSMISLGTANHPHSNWYYRAPLQHSLVRGCGKCSSPTAHLCFNNNNQNVGKTVTEYQIPFPLPPSIIREMITDLFPKPSKMPTSITKSLSEGVTKSLQMILEAKHCAITNQYSTRSQTVYMWVGKSATETKLDFSWK